MCACRHDLAQLLLRLKHYDKAEKVLKQFLEQETKGIFILPDCNVAIYLMNLIRHKGESVLFVALIYEMKF